MVHFRRLVTVLLAALITAAPLPAPSPAWGATVAPAEPGAVQWVVSLDAPLAAGSRRGLKDAGVAVERVSADGRRALVTGAGGESGVVSRLKKVKGVAWAEPVAEFTATKIPSDPAYSDQWGLPAVKAPAAWDITRGASTVVVAIIDTGVDLSNAEFTGRLTAGYDFVNGDTSAGDDEGHGTHVASIMGAATDNGVGGVGLAPACRIMPIKVLDSEGSGTSYDVAEGIRWAADRGAEVINLSLGSRDYTQVIAEAVQYALSKDVVVVSATGNEGTSVNYPAKLAGVVGVSAVDRSLGLASFSNRGPEVDIAAPGVDILATLPGGRMEAWQGTSMASPFVAAAAALVRAQNPALTQAQVVARLTSSARDIGAAGKDTLFGAGLLDAAKALGSASVTSDDDIPGVEAPASPVAGTLSATGDLRDVYQVRLQAGQRLTATLQGAAGTDFDLYIYGPTAQHVGDADRPLAVAAGTVYPESIAYVAGRTDTFYLVAEADTGSGSYTLAYTLSAPAPTDDDVPGIAIPTSPINGSLATGSDVDDVYRVDLTPGDRLTATLSGDPGTDFDLYLFPPEVPTVDGSFDSVASSKEISYPERLSYTATRAGTYYLDAFAYQGAGNYGLTWTIERTTLEFDDDVPGRAAPPSPVAGDVSASLDADDVFWIDLAAGQQLTAQLSAGAATDFDLYLYAPGTATVDGSIPSIMRSVKQEYPEEIAYVATTAGRYYLDVFAYDGSGAYTLTYATSSATPDDNIPGAPASASPITGMLDEEFDADDVHRISLTAGQQLTAQLTGPAETDFDLYLFDSNAADVGADDPATVSYGVQYPERVTFIAPATGTYYLDAYAYMGSGAYTLSYTIGAATASRTNLALTATKPVGETDTSLSAVLTNSAGGSPVAGASVTFEAYIDDSWRHVAFVDTGSDGTAVTVATSAGARRFRAIFSGDATHASSVSSPAEVPERSAAGVTIAASSLAPAYGRSVTLTARARDLTSGGALTGDVRIERLSGSAWVPVTVAETDFGEVRATVRTDSATRYRAVFGGSTTHDPAFAESLLVRPQVSLTAPSVPTSARRNVRFTSTGVMRPRHTSGTSPVRIQCFRLEGNRWVLRKTVTARVSNVTGGSRFSASVSLPSTGTWKMRAYHPQDSAHATTYGGYSRTVRVR